MVYIRKFQHTAITMFDRSPYCFSNRYVGRADKKKNKKWLYIVEFNYSAISYQ